MIFNLFGKKADAKEGQIVGEVIHYFKKVKAAVIKVNKGSIEVGDKIRVKGHTTDFSQKIASMQINNDQVEKAGKGKEVAVKVGKKSRRGDKVWKI